MLSVYVTNPLDCSRADIQVISKGIFVNEVDQLDYDLLDFGMNVL